MRLLSLLALGHMVVDITTFTASIVLGQAYMPRNPGMASGLIVGFATARAGSVSPRSGGSRITGA